MNKALKLQSHTSRKYVPSDTDLRDLSILKKLMDNLETDLKSTNTATDLACIIYNYQEVDVVLSEAQNLAYIAMTCNTEDIDLERAYNYFVEEINTFLEPIQDQLNQLILNHPGFASLPKEFDLYKQSLKTTILLFNKSNISLWVEVSKLQIEYQKIVASMTAPWDGKESTLTKISDALEEVCRLRREAAWQLIAARRLEDSKRLDDIYTKQIGLLTQIAKNCGYNNYMEYYFVASERDSYTAKDCSDFHLAIEQLIVPITRELSMERKKALGVSTLRPWDMAADIKHNNPLKPFDSVEELANKAKITLGNLDPKMGEYLEDMQQKGLLDLDNRMGKAPGGYQVSLAEARVPFIFMNGTNTNADVNTFIHECGHAFHTYQSKNVNLFSNRQAPLEFCEVASMGLELMVMGKLEAFYNTEESKQATNNYIEEILYLLPSIAMVDCFQHWVYTNPNHTSEERNNYWISLEDRFSSGDDWTGLKEIQSRLWQRIPHIFETPFYYIEYGIAQLGALQLWNNYQKDPANTIKQYLYSLSLGGSKPLKELFNAAEISLKFDLPTIQPLAQQLKQELNKLKD